MSRSALLAAPVAALLIGLAAPAFAANADHPYNNVDKRNDAGNKTGDSRVDNLNRGQLNENYKGPVELRTPSGPSAGAAPGAPASPTKP
ncbi:MAG: hypothetical protein BGO51_17260 [Rhodospirillales bacterium 69-11]|nr:hypothetical protein [Rhodospirillales bacterium]MBN8926132.1 hypothetical protein [Rhodospirillales bacterium]OJW19540.1 MAG: hypothetical protein BGO51_17260 [Rhodospirillales bacterium 69-11]